jgi:hypothetical protein
MICYLFLKFLNAYISEKICFSVRKRQSGTLRLCRRFCAAKRRTVNAERLTFSEEGRDSISVAKPQNFAQIIRLRNQCREHCRRAVLRFKRRIGPLSCVLRRTSRRNRGSRRSPLFAKPIGRRSTPFCVTAVMLPQTPRIYSRLSSPICSRKIR